MKFLRLGPVGHEIPATLDAASNYRDISSIVDDILPDTLDSLLSVTEDSLADLPIIPKDVRIGPPICAFRNLICVGLNYKDHAIETGSAIPKEPMIFQKPVTCVVGPNDRIHIPYQATKVDWEVELALIIGKKCKHVTAEEAPSCIFGYTVFFDVSERVFQKERGGGQFFKGKCCDGFGPMGPFIDTSIDPSDLRLFCSVNGVTMQDSRTSNMLFSCYEIVEHLSQFMTLWPGDVIATGTPAGVGAARGQFLKEGDVVCLGIDGLGEQSHDFVGEAV